MAVQPVQPLPRPAAALPPQHLRHALRRLAAGDLAGAESRLRGQLDVDPHLAVAWRALGEVQRRRRQPLAAWQSIRQALQVQPAELGHWRALTDAQHELLAAGLDLAAVALAQRQLNAAKTLLEDLALLAAATAPQTRSDTTARSEQAATAAIAEALSAAGLPACPVSASLARLQGRRRSTAAHPLMLQVPAAQLEDAATALQKLGLTRTPGSADAALVLRWPAHPVSVVLLPGPADPAATWTQVGPLGFLVSPAQLVACQESDGAPAASLWQTHDQLRQWTDGRLTNWTPIRRPRSPALWQEPSSDLFGRIGDHMQQAMSALNDIGRHLACQGDGIRRLSRADDEVRSLVGRIP
jgi:tetratricopeptide (TPR) repeat protein